MNILIVTGPYPPDLRSISTMIKELADELSGRGHDVTVVTCRPHYNLAEEAIGKTYSECAFEGRVWVIRVKTPPNHGPNYIVRGLAQLASPYFFLRKIKQFIKGRVDAVMVYSPPLPYVSLGSWVKKAYGAKYILNIQDIFPQNAIDLGVLRNPLLIRLFESIEEKAYRNSDIITSHTKSSAGFLTEEKKVPREKVHIIPNWIDIREGETGVPLKNFREEYGLKDEFVVLFAGIFGPSQNLEYVIDVAERLTRIPDIRFLFVGDGIEKSKLEETVRERGLKNVSFHPFVPSGEYHCLVKSVDVGLVCLSRKNKTPVVPGKVLGYMAGSVPIIAFLNRESDAHGLIKEAGCGFSMVEGDVEQGAELVKAMYEKRGELKRYGENGLQYAKQHYSRSVCIDRLEELILHACQSGDHTG